MPPVGIFPDRKFSSCILNYKAKDQFFLYTDGLTEARNSRGEEFGPDRLLEAAGASGEPAVLVGTVFEEVMRFSGNEGIKDDLTAVSVACIS